LTCERGNTWAARKISLPKLENEFKKILKEINWVGPIEFEFIRDSFDEEFKLIEINCRFPAWISYSKDVGYNLPIICTDLALSKKINDFYERKDLIFMRNCLELDTDMIKFGKFLKQQSL
jgi:carbamoyl-phosphate synthase large subunit